MACPPPQAIAMSARLAPSTVAHVLRLVGSSYIEAGPGPATRLHRSLLQSNTAPRVLRTSRRFASSAHAFAEEPFLAPPVGQPLVLTPKKARHYPSPKEPRAPTWAHVPVEVDHQLFSDTNQTAVRFRSRFDEHDLKPTTLLPVYRLKAVYDIFSAPDTQFGDWAWLADTLAQAKEQQPDWTDLPGSESLFHSLRGLALAHCDEWDYARVNLSIGIKTALAALPSLDHFPAYDTEVVALYVRRALTAGRAADVANLVRFSGQKLHKLLSQHTGSQSVTATSRRLREVLHVALCQLDDPFAWITSQLVPEADGRPSRAVYHVAIAILSALVADTSRTADAFVLWRNISQKFNSTFIPAPIASQLAYNLAKQGHHITSHTVFESLRETCAVLPHSALSRELWVFADEGQVEEAQRVWNEINARYGPTRDDRLAYATAFAAKGDIAATKDTVSRLLGTSAFKDVRALSVLQRACLTANDADEALRYLDLATEIRPTLPPFQSLLNLYADQGNVDRTVSLFSRLVSLGLQPSTKFYTTLVSVFANAADHINAQAVFDAMVAAGHRPDAVSWSALINSSIEAGQWQLAADQCEQVPKHLQDDTSLLTVIMKAYVLISAPMEVVLRLFRRLENPAPQAWALAIQSAVDHNNLDYALSLFNDMDSKAQLDSFASAPNVYVFSILLAAYLRTGDRNSARTVYDMMIARKVLPTSVTYGIITTAFANSPGESSFEQANSFAMSIIGQLGVGQRTGSRGKAGENVFGPLLVAAGRQGDLARTKVYYDLIKEYGGGSISVSTKLMDAYRRAGELKSVYRIWLKVFRDAKRLIPRSTPELLANPLHPPTRTRNNVLCVPLSITIQAMAEAGLHARLKQLWLRVRTSGFGFDSQNYNHYAIALAQTGDVEGAFHIVDRVILPRQDEVRERYYPALRAGPSLKPVDVDSQPDEFDGVEVETDIDGETTAAAALTRASHDDSCSATFADVAEPSHRPPNRRHDFQPIIPPQYAEDESTSLPTLDMSVLRNWRPSDILWRPSNKTIAILEQAYRQLEDQRAYRAWIGLGIADEEADDDYVVRLPEFNNTTVKDLDGSDKRMSPKLLLARLNRKYARVVGLIMLHRRKRAARDVREQRERR